MKNQRIFDQSAIYKCMCSFGILLLLFVACKKDETEPVKLPLAVTDYYPNSGNKGTLVTVEGTGFSSDANDITATFAGVNADIVSVTATEVVMRAPVSGTTGEIIMKVNDEAVTVGNYTYQELSVQRISPVNGAAGAHIRISGEGFGSISGPAEVYINGKLAVVVSASDTLLVAEVPVAAGSGPVVVKVNGKEASGQTFKFQSVTAIKPLTGGKGTRVRITGSGFDEVLEGNYVDFNGKQALVEEAADGYLVVVAPDGVSTGPLSITINKQKVIGPIFTVVALPAILNVTPLSGPAGAVMTITGTTFSSIADENKVKINGVNVPITAATATRITLTLPGNTGSGKIVLSVNDQLAEGPDFKDQNLGISRLSPESGLAGTEVTITGTGFNTTAGQNIVTFNGTAATVVSATATSIVVTAPEGFTSGPLKVVTGGLTALAPVNFNHAGVVTLAGGPGKTDLELTQFRTGGLAVDDNGNVFVLELGRNRIKKITPQGVVSLFAGSATGQAGNQNGTGSDALFSLSTSSGMDIDQQGNLYVSDYGSQSIRKITPQGLVSTFAANIPGLTKISFDEAGILYVNTGFSTAVKIDKNGIKTAVGAIYGMNADTRPAAFAGVYYYVSSETNYLNASDQVNNQNLLRWVGANYGYADGIGSGAMFGAINSLAADGKGNILAADNSNFAIRKINISTKEVTTLAKFTSGYKDGSINEAKFGNLADIAIDKDGIIYVIDVTNNAIRKVFLK